MIRGIENFRCFYTKQYTVFKNYIFIVLMETEIVFINQYKTQVLKEVSMKDLVGAIVIHAFFAFILIWLIIKISS